MRIPTSSLALAAALAVASTPDAVFAQGPALTTPLDSGRLVRFHLVDGTAVRGRLLRPFAPDSVQIAFCRYPAPPCRTPDASTVAQAEARLIASLEVARGSRWRPGLAIGATAGAIVGALVGSLHQGLCEFAERSDCEVAPLVWLLSGAVGGAAWGALLGSQSVVWEPVP